MKTHVLIGMILIISGCSLQPRLNESPQPVQNVPSAGHVIVSFKNVYAECLSLQTVGWKVEESDVLAVESSINALFAKPDMRLKGLLNDNPRKAPFPLSDYYMQYAGAINDGKKLIVGKGFHKLKIDPKEVLQPEDTIGNWGGGAYYFTVVYDVADQRIVELEYNAPF